MFIVSAKLNPKKALTGVVLFGVVLIGIIVLVGTMRRGEAPGNQVILAPSDAERVAYLEGLGWTADPSPIETLSFALPSPLNDSYTEYNKLQLQQGFDLTPYAGMQVTRYSYKITNYPDHPDDVQADLYLCGEEIIGGDILYCGDKGFVATLVYPG